MDSERERRLRELRRQIEAEEYEPHKPPAWFAWIVVLPMLGIFAAGVIVIARCVSSLAR